MILCFVSHIYFKVLVFGLALTPLFADPTGFIYLSNGDVVAGENLVLKDKSLQIFAPTLDAPVELEMDRVLAWSTARISAPESEIFSRIFLRNGDQFDARLTGINAEWMEFIPASGMKNAVNLSEVVRVEFPAAQGELLYRGPQPLSDFRSRNQSVGPDSGWVEADGGIFSKAERKGRLELVFEDLPDAFRISMEVQSVGPSSLALDLLGRGPRQSGPDWIILRQRQDRLVLSTRGQSNQIPVGEFALPQNKDGSYRLELYADVKANRYVVRWNGQLIREWKEGSALPGELFSLNTLRAQFSGAAPIRIHELTLNSWDGRLPIDRNREADGIEVLFRNQDRGVWKSLRLQDEKLTMVDGEGSELVTSLSVVTDIVFQPDARVRASAPGGDAGDMAQIYFALPGNRLAVHGLQIRGGMVEAEHPAFRDPLFLSLRSIQGIQWLSRSRGYADETHLPDELRLLSGERVTGFAGQIARGRLQFQPVWSENEFAVPVRNIGTLNLNDNHSEEELTAAAMDSAPHYFRFHHRDGFRGTVRSVNENEITLRSPWGQDLRVKRGGLRKIYASGEGEGLWVYRWGGEEDWHLHHARGSRPNRSVSTENAGEAGATARGGVIYSRRLPNLPDQVVIDLSWAANEIPGMLFNLYSPDPSGGAEIGSAAGGVQVNVSSNRILARAGREADFVLFEREPDVPYRLQMFFDPGADKIHVFLNGERLKVLNVPIPKAMAARWMGFQSITNDYTPEFFQVQPWQGDPEPQRLRPEAPDGEEIRLSGNRFLQGRLLAGPEGRLNLASPDENEVLSLAMDEMQNIRFPASAKSLPRRTARDARIVLRGETQAITLAVEAFDRGQLRGSSDTWASPLVIPKLYIQSIRFNLYPPASFYQLE